MRGFLLGRWAPLIGWVAGWSLAGVVRALRRPGSASFAEKLLHATPSLVPIAVFGGLCILVVILLRGDISAKGGPGAPWVAISAGALLLASFTSLLQVFLARGGIRVLAALTTILLGYAGINKVFEYRGPRQGKLRNASDDAGKA